MAVQVSDAPDRHRYEAAVDGRVAGFAAYADTDQGVRVFTHTEVEPAYGGRGVGGALVRGALDDVRARHFAARPLCPFIAGWIDRHPEYADLVAE